MGPSPHTSCSVASLHHKQQWTELLQLRLVANTILIFCQMCLASYLNQTPRRQKQCTFHNRKLFNTFLVIKLDWSWLFNIHMVQMWHPWPGPGQVLWHGSDVMTLIRDQETSATGAQVVSSYRCAWLVPLLNRQRKQLWWFRSERFLY